MMQIYGRVKDGFGSCKETVFNFVNIVCGKMQDLYMKKSPENQANNAFSRAKSHLTFALEIV